MSLTNDDILVIGNLLDAKLGIVSGQFDEKLRGSENSILRQLDEKLDTMSGQFDEKLNTMSGQFDEKLNTMSEQFDKKLNTMSEQFDKKLNTMSEQFDEKLRDSENSILRQLDIVQEHSNNHFEDIEQRIDRIELTVHSIKVETSTVNLLVDKVSDMQIEIDELKQKVS